MYSILHTRTYYVSNCEVCYYCRRNSLLIVDEMHRWKYGRKYQPDDHRWRQFWVHRWHRVSPPSLLLLFIVCSFCFFYTECITTAVEWNITPPSPVFLPVKLNQVLDIILLQAFAQIDANRKGNSYLAPDITWYNRVRQVFWYSLQVTFSGGSTWFAVPSSSVQYTTSKRLHRCGRIFLWYSLGLCLLLGFIFRYIFCFVSFVPSILCAIFELFVFLCPSSLP